MPATLNEGGINFVKQGIENSVIFRRVSPTHREKLTAMAVPKYVHKGEFVFREGMSSAGLFLICHGVINVHRLGDDGSERIMGLFRAGESFAEASLLPRGKYPASARAETDAQLLLIPRRPFVGLLATDADFSLHLIVALNARIHGLVSTLDDLRSLGGHERLLKWLLSHRLKSCPDTAYGIHLDLSKGALASELGIRQETLSRSLASLRKQGLITIQGREIKVLNPQKIEASLASH